MRAYVITSGAIFGLLTIAHLWRMAVEPHLATDLVYIFITAIAAGLGIWAWRVLRRSNR